MQRNRLRAATTWVAIVAGVVAMPAVAHAEATAPVIAGVGAADGDPGLLRVTVASDTAVREVTVTVTPRGGGTSTVVSSFQLVSGQPENGIWQSERLVLGQYGDYDLSVDVADADGDHSAQPGLGKLNYRPWPRLTENAIGPAVLDYWHRDLVATGTVGRFDPKTGTEAPWSGLRVDLTAQHYMVETTTDADGHYLLTRRPTSVTAGEQGPVTVSIWDSPGAPEGQRLQIDHGSYTVNVTPARIRLDAEQKTVKYGYRYSVAGTAEYLVDGVWQPHPNARIHAGEGRYAYQRATTDQSGRFSLSLPVPREDGTWTVRRAAVTGDGSVYLTPATDSLPFHVINKVYIAWEGAWFTSRSEIHVEGQWWNSGDGPMPQAAKVYLQQSPTGTSAWTTLGYLPVDQDGYFHVDAYVEHPKGYWRLYYPGAADFQSAVSRIMHYSRRDTRIRSFNASPEPVRVGGALTVSGQLQQLTDAGWRAFPTRRVHILFRPRGGSTFRELATALTGTRGRFTVRLPARRDGSWAATWLTPTAKYVDAHSWQDYVDVN